MTSEEVSGWGKLGEAWEKFQYFLSTNFASLPSTKTAIPDDHQIKQINDIVYELYAPKDEDKNMEIIFFHGLRPGDCSRPYVNTWMSRSEPTELWPKRWLGESFPKAQILSISYDSSGTRGNKGGRLDLHLMAENLFLALIRLAKVGQTWGCPIVMVGHCLGGLLIKQFCLHLGRKEFTLPGDRELAENFLQNVRGVFLFATPQQGINFPESISGYLKPSSLLGALRILDTQTGRLNRDFNHYRSVRNWVMEGVGESNKTTNSANPMGSFYSVMVEEASARLNMDNFSTANADHFDICRPVNRMDVSYQALEDFIRKVTGKVVVHQHQSLGLPDIPVGLEERAQEVQEKLKDVPILGIVGMGGIGKTTLAKMVFDKIFNKFEYTCFLGDVKMFPIHELQERLLSKFHWRGKEISGANITWADLRNKTTLIVMDDVDSKDQLRDIPKMQQLGKNSRLIITARDHTFSEKYDTKSYLSYDVRFLNEDEAKKLFCKYAFEQGEIPKALIEHVQAIINKCDGLPLLLEVLGQHLRGKENDVQVWKETIHKLHEAEPIDGLQKDSVLAKLRVSYDALVPALRGMFVDAGTIFFGRRLEMALAAWSTNYGNSETGWKRLVSMSLVKEVNNQRYYRADQFDDIISPGGDRAFKVVWVHEQLRDLGKHVAPDKMVQCLAYDDDQTIMDETFQLLNDNKVSARRTEILRMSSRSDVGKTIQLQSVARLKHLKYMEFQNILFQKGSRKNLPRELSMLRCSSSAVPVNLFGVPEPKNIPEFPFSLEGMEKLAILELWYWKTPEAFSETLGKLTHLRILSLISIEGLTCLPNNFGELRQLKRLNLVNIQISELPQSLGSLSFLEVLFLRSLHLVELPDSFSTLTSLKSIWFVHCRKLKRLPSSFSRLPQLQTLFVEDCCSLEELGDTFGKLSTLRRLDLTGTSLERLPESFGNLSTLRRLDLTGTTNLERLPDSFGHLSTLRRLDLTGTSLKRLPDSLGNLSSLRRLGLAGTSLERLPDSFGNLSNLHRLDLTGTSLERLPDSFGHLRSLEELVLRPRLKTGRLRNLPDNFGELRKLRSLTLEYRNEFQILPLNTLERGSEELHEEFDLGIDAGRVGSLPKGMPESFGQLQALEMLDLTVPGMWSLPESIGDLPSLQTLRIWCDKHEKLHEDVALHSCNLELTQRGLASLGNISTLQDMKLSFVQAVKVLPEELGNLSSLKKLELDGWIDLECLPDSLGRLSSLEKLILFHCDKLECLIEKNLGHLSSLQKLDIRNCNGLVRLPESLGQLPSLQDVDIRYCDGLVGLPESLGQLPSLKTLRIFNCDGLVGLPESLGDLSSLKLLLIRRCHGLMGLPESLGQLPSLQKLEIKTCDRLVGLPESLGDLSSLQELLIRRCNGLTRLPESLGHLSSLQELLIRRCHGLMGLPESLGQLPSLQKLWIIDCDGLVGLPESLGQLPSLLELDIRHCDGLVGLPESLGHLISQKKVEVEGCANLPDIRRR